MSIGWLRQLIKAFLPYKRDVPFHKHCVCCKVMRREAISNHTVIAQALHKALENRRLKY